MEAVELELESPEELVEALEPPAELVAALEPPAVVLEPVLEPSHLKKFARVAPQYPSTVLPFVANWW